MPIRPEHRHHYSRASGWPELRRQILARAAGCCERCGVRNHSVVCRESPGRAPRMTRIVLTIAHLDQQPANRDPANLAAMCQKCHVTHDAGQHARNASHTRALKRADPNQTSLFQEDR